MDEIRKQPRRFVSTAIRSGLVNDERPYAPYTLNVEYSVPWRTLSGRQSLYLDHPWYREFDEGLPTFKGKIDPSVLDEINRGEEKEGLILNFMTPHGKWSIHSTFSDNLRMLTLSRGGQAVWINSMDAAKEGIEDNDWVEVYNNNGVIVCRSIVTSRVPKGSAIMYHAPERTLNIPKSNKTGRRGGVHNSVSRIRLKPTLMLGGYAQFSYHPGRRQRPGDPVRARHPHLRERDPQHARHLGDPGGEEAQPPADRGGPEPRHGPPRQGDPDGARGRRGGRRRAPDRGPQRPGPGTARRCPEPVPRAVRSAHGRAARDRARPGRSLPLARVPQALSQEKILEAVTLTAEALPWMGWRDARIVVCALNPHAGDGGKLGSQEIDIIEPTIFPYAAAK